MNNSHFTISARRGFTLIELLTVIAIIAILTAIIFPVFATVRENARQSTSLSHLHAISTGLGQFQLDNHRNPDVLFGYVYYQYDTATMGPGTTVVPMDQAYAQAQSDAQQYNADLSLFFTGLYPEYIKDVSVFKDPNNPENDDTNLATLSTGGIPVNVLCPSSDAACGFGATAVPPGQLAASTRQFYKADAYDASPQIAATNNDLNTSAYVTRYQSSWTDINGGYNAACTSSTTPATCYSDGSNNLNAYTHQLRWRNPPAETYVTSTTYHVPAAGKVLVLFEGGAVEKMDVSRYLNGSGADASTVAVSGGVSQANFWKLTP